MELIFLKPQLAWLILVLVLMSLIWFKIKKTGYVASTTLSLSPSAFLHPSLVRQLPRILIAFSIFLLILAAMQPVIPLAEQEVESQGLDIAIVLDLSESMQELMDRENQTIEQPEEIEMMTMTQQGITRLMTTKDALRDFIIGRRDDRIGMVVFADNAYIVSPLTVDHDFLLHYLDMVDTNILKNERKTAIGNGISLANGLLLRQQGDERRGQVIMVYTDGEHNHGMDPLEVLEQLYLSNVKVHLVGVDLEDRIKERENVKLLINKIVDQGGNYFDANTRDDMFRASAGIDELEKGRVVTREYVQQVPVYQWFVIPGLILISLGLALRAFPYFSNYS